MKLKQFLVGATLALAALSMTAELAARSMGGGKSFGRQSQSVNRMAPRPAPAPSPAQQQARPGQPAPAPAAPAPRPSPWKGILGGALLGLGLGALLSHFGLGGALASAIGTILTFALIAGAIFLVWRLVRGKMGGNANRPQPANAFGGGFGGNNGNNGNFGNAPLGGSATPEIGSRIQQPAPQPAAFEPVQPASYTPVAPAPHQQWGVPADFDQASFLRHAKGNFIRLQAAWDKGDINDIREFTTPEVFAEMRLQIQERNGKADFTDVVHIDAELLGIENDGKDYLASVQFSGQIKPAPDALAEPFNEVWNLVKPVNGNAGWLLGGIQQLA